MAKLVNERTIVNHLTGEIVHSETHTIQINRLEKEPPYVKMYINDIGVWQGLSSGETSILYSVSSAVDYDGVVHISTYLKAKIKKQLGVTDGFIRNTIVKLAAKHILLKSGDFKSVYKLNPYWFGKGDWKDIIEQRKAFVVQITKAYGMPMPQDINPVSFLSVKKSIENKDVEDGQRRLID